MPSCAGSHVPRSAAVPAPPCLAPHPIVLQPAGGRGGLWVDARATPNPPKQMPPICHLLGDAAGQPNCAPAGQRVKRGGAEGDRPGWAEATCLAGRFSESPKFYKVCLVLAWFLSLPSDGRLYWPDWQPSLCCRPSPSHLPTDLLQTAGIRKGLCRFHYLHLLSFVLHFVNRSLKPGVSLVSHLALKPSVLFSDML